MMTGMRWVVHYVEWEQSYEKYTDCLLCNKKWNDIAADIATENVTTTLGDANCTREQMSLL